ncbi:hypothetical protein COCC4DRAFT_23625 [Bipolaris maydis ATCC 48331]|uniref:Uncharacterized protein n=2 Tax=Cochliobolus heterostrophus TaxID=5016 RepID=M2UMF4_COCH5|nr:uncharacterized protein COCC4DRAFT_23625 [Bipolaris maydis ATCC 48331]EMD89138.1 hypothetical protein COCHEDRAFT_1032214 [Bipolaris maydis C5]KAH7552506.1 hypothetical protein BM1_08457 [Bipolaris maydis]ENI05142.1 hypothetical protein COCC4DRAFT_23625 [Bipolaris maydis ATCC 48331]KAJ5020608.1 hypothetical protein J3E73DRAFT_201190 [Bipolaris maydis]KAJ6194445.1 hypothetical protein J3E72DRAFT_378056 [Bipolaris maydis]
MSQTVAFLTTFAPLPATAPSSHAHIIKDLARGTSKPRLQDAIVTLLYNISFSTLTTFLDPDIKEFRLIQTRRRGRDAGEQLIVMKRGCKVIVQNLLLTYYPSFTFSFNTPKQKKYMQFAINSTQRLTLYKKNYQIGLANYCPELFDTLEFDNLVRMEIDKDGAWKLVYASYRDYFCKSWDAVWEGRTVNRGWDCLSLRAWVEDPRAESRKTLEILAEELMLVVVTGRMWEAIGFASTLATG